MKHFFVSIIIFSSFQLYAQDGKNFNVKDFGAKGDGIADDTKSIQQCFDNATSRGGGTVIIPQGDYKTSKNLFLNFHSDVSLKITGQNATIYPTDKYYYIFCDNSDKNNKKPLGSLSISGININAEKLPHPQSFYYDNPSCAYGLFLTNLKAIDIQNCTFSNIYGSAIKLVLLKDVNDTTASTTVSVKNNKILNCWGLNPTKDYLDKKNPQKFVYDNYGDGVAIWGYRNAVIDGNYIFNDVSKTGYYGRGGVVVEADGENSVITNNVINGYDRGVHIEGDKGGHYIANNKISGSQVAIYFWLADNFKNRPVKIENNTFSYKNEAEKYNLKTIVGDRKFIMFAGKGTSTYQGSIVKNNTFLDQPNSNKLIMQAGDLQINKVGNKVQ